MGGGGESMGIPLNLAVGHAPCRFFKISFQYEYVVANYKLIHNNITRCRREKNKLVY